MFTKHGLYVSFSTDSFKRKSRFEDCTGAQNNRIDDTENFDILNYILNEDVSMKEEPDVPEEFSLSSNTNSKTLPEGSLGITQILNSLLDFDLINTDSSPDNWDIYSNIQTVNPLIVEKCQKDRQLHNDVVNLTTVQRQLETYKESEPNNDRVNTMNERIPLPRDSTVFHKTLSRRSSKKTCNEFKTLGKVRKKHIKLVKMKRAAPMEDQIFDFVKCYDDSSIIRNKTGNVYIFVMVILHRTKITVTKIPLNVW